MSDWQKQTTRADLPIPCGSEIEPRMIWSACLGSIPSRMWISTVWSNFVGGNFFSTATASAIGSGASVFGFVSSIFRMRLLSGTVWTP